MVVPGPGADGRNKSAAERLMQPLLSRIDAGLGRLNEPASGDEPGPGSGGGAGWDASGPDRPPFEFVVVEAVLYVLEQVRDLALGV